MTRYHNFYNKHLSFACNMRHECVGNFKHISIITNKRLHILSLGFNSGKTHTLTQKYGYKYPVIHSELDALTKLSYTDKQQSLYLFNYRFNHNGVIGQSRPCEYCLPWCVTVFDKIFYSTKDGLQGL